MPPPLLHIISRASWDDASQQSHYEPPTFETEGFVHCSYPDQVVVPANERYRGHTDLVLLVIDPTALDAELIHEDLYGSGIDFPHIYGAISVPAVTDVIDFPCNPDGTFSLPLVLVH